MESKTQVRFSDYVRKLRADQKLSQREVAQRARSLGFKISDAFLAQVESGEQLPGPRKMVALAAGLGVDAVELFKVAAGIKVESEIPPRVRDAVAQLARVAGVRPADLKRTA